MLYSTLKAYTEAREDDIRTTVEEVMSDVPLYDDMWRAQFKSRLTGILSDYYDRAAGQGRFMEIMDPSDGGK